MEQIEATVNANSFTFPSPYLPFSPESEMPRMHSDIRLAGSLITSAAAQLITLVRPAPLTLLDVMMQVKLIAHRRGHFSHENNEVPRLYCHKDCDQHTRC